ncbi:MarR family winged helix-turn-helix transcriptional regulator [Streptomyces sp. NPDC005047]
MDNDALGEELRQAIGELVRAVRSADSMPAGEAAILGHLDRGRPRTTAELAHLRGVTHQAASKSVKELLANGLLRVEPHPSDGRKLLLHITDSGRTRLQHQRTQRADRLGTAIHEALSSTERRQLRQCIPLLTRLTARINEE